MENNNILFIPINKCGTTSIKKLVTGYSHITIPNNDDLHKISKEDMWKKSTKVTIVRNPYYRFLSLYYMIKGQGSPMNLSQLLKIITNDDIKYTVANGGLIKHTHQYIKRHGLSLTHKHYQIYDNEKDLLNVDYFFDLDTLRENYDEFKSVMRIDKELPVANQSKNKNDLSVLTKEHIKIINEYFHKDFEVFNYDKIE